MKKFISIMLAAVLVLSALALTACGGGGDSDLSDSKYVGTWKAQTISIGDDSEELEEMAVMTINGDGTGTLSDEDGEDVSEFTWEPTSDGFKTKGDVKLKFKDDGDNIKATVIGVDLIFEKQ